MISFKDKIQNIIDNEKSVSLRFLSLQEQAQINNLVKDKSSIHFNGGYEGSELKRVSFFGAASNVVCYKIIHNNKHLILTHQNILGSLLGLQITRDSIGDILPKQGVFFATEEIRAEIEYSFTQIGKHSIEVHEIDSTTIKTEQEFIELRTTVESLRLDLIVGKITNMSRNQAQDYIKNEFVKKNHNITTKPTSKVSENDIISIRKYGRFIIRDTSNTNKKGKIVVNYAKYS